MGTWMARSPLLSELGQVTPLYVPQFPHLITSHYLLSHGLTASGPGRINVSVVWLHGGGGQRVSIEL